MITNRIICIAAVVLILVDFIWFFVRLKKNGLKKKEELGNKVLIRICGIYACAAIILILNFFIIFGTFSDIVLSGCSVIAIEITNRELLQEV